MNKVVVWIFLILLLITPVLASEQYSYEKSEELKHLIKWRDYGSEAFAEAAIENKPIFLLLTAPSWCYWCQVYESEEYLFNSAMVDIINEQTIPVYVDADKRSDLTRKYLEGGWPSTTILSPTGDRIFGYSGPRPVPFMITNVNNAHNFVANQAYANEFELNYFVVPIPNITYQDITEITNSYQQHLLRTFDSEYGGFGTGQKFPQGRALFYALEVYEQTQDVRFLNIVEKTLEGQYTSIDELQTNYNLFDPIEGGFHRYGTARDYTPPHYEKMLYDNARLLKAYLKLQQINPENKYVDEVVEMTNQYMIEEYYDGAGFYANTDVNGEETYYGQVNREGKARVEPTKFTDWNSEAILTYLYYYELNGKYETVITNSLDFFVEEMISDDGALHYYKNGEKGVQGSLLDNAYLTLTLIEAYETFENETYLEAAKKLAEYSLDNLYDWNSAGFFERNSKDIADYAPGEALDIGKPQQENSIMALALLKLYLHTNNFEYLEAGSNTVKLFIREVQPYDRGYYLIKAGELVIEEDLFTTQESYSSYIDALVEKRQEHFWLNDLIHGTTFSVDDTKTEKIEGSILILLFIALVAGLLSFISPCTLPILPAYIAYMLHQKKKKQATLYFFLGLGLTFTLLGMSASFIGSFLKNNLSIFNIVTGSLIIVFGVLMLMKKGFKGIVVQQKQPVTPLQTMIFGAIFGLSWTPCVGPILAAILVLASTTTTVIMGGGLLLVYALGLGIPLYLLSLHLDSLKAKNSFMKFLKGKELRFGKYRIHTSELISGILFIALGVLIITGGLTLLNQLVGTGGVQGWIIMIEEKLLSLL